MRRSRERPPARNIDSFIELCELIQQFAAEKNLAMESVGEDTVQRDDVDVGGADIEDDGSAGFTPLPEWKPLLQVLLKNIRLHIHPPGGLGSGHRTLANKCEAEVNKWHHQTPQQSSQSSQLAACAKSYQQHCGDMGCEFGIPAFNLTGNHEQLLPHWLEREEIPPDIEPEEMEAGSDVSEFEGFAISRIT